MPYFRLPKSRLRPAKSWVPKAADGSLDHLRKEGDEEQQLPKMVLWRVLVAVDVDDIAYGLEHEKGDAQWEDQLRQRQLHPCPVGQGQEEIGGEIPVFQHI